ASPDFGCSMLDLETILPRGLSPGTFSPVALGLLSAVCAGHAAFLVSCLNLIYARHWPRKLLKVCRYSCELTILAAPFLFLATFDVAFGQPAATSVPGIVWSSYAQVCVLIGATVVPVMMVLRGLRREPAAGQSHTREIVDVARELGYTPIGEGKHRRLARLPFNEIFQVEFSERVLVVPRLPEAWDGLSILHLTDLHLRGVPDLPFYQFLMERCRALEPDIVVLTGDIVDSEKHHRWIVPVLGKLRWKQAAFAILGNHDYWYDPELSRRRLARLGIQVLGNSWRKLELAGQPLIAIGHEGPWFVPEPNLTACPTEGFRLCLSHTPDNIHWAAAHQIDLMLAGHVHGGQIRFPLIGSVFVPSRFGRRYDCGLFQEGPTTMYVSRGLAGQHPVRYNCRPEITRLVLRCPRVLAAAEALQLEERLSSTTMPPSRKRA
ncbi:MAG: metallophosphoesterase, partial [Gemmataceae bacterium]